jgi:hypothetical protein
VPVAAGSFVTHFPKGGSAMEPRCQERKDREPSIETKEVKPRRFRLVKLEEHIAPGISRLATCTFCPRYTKHCMK